MNHCDMCTVGQIVNGKCGFCGYVEPKDEPDPDEKKLNFTIYSEQFEAFCIYGGIETTLEAIKHEFLLDMANDDEETVIRIKRHDMTEAEMQASPSF